jgi:cytochrome c oxidase subunit II
MDDPIHSVTDAGGPQAQHIEHLWWLMFVACTVVFLVVMGLLAFAVWRRRGVAPTAEREAAGRRQALRWVAGAAAGTAVILFGFLIASLLTDRRLDRIETKDALTITVTGQQWWWDVRYDHPEPSQVIVTANEIHVPVGRPVRLRLRSIDVIHSFWVPSLGGKRDLIPGRDTSLWIQADRAGVFQGQCAEFCGHQHAHMRFQVVAETPEEFQAWQENQRLLAREPTTPEQVRGRDVFLSSTCIMCHSVRGTLAGSRAGPDLTHLASRRTIAASTLPNARGPLT